MNQTEMLNALYDELQRQTAQMRLDLACAEQALRRITYSAESSAWSARVADAYLRGKARRCVCIECGEPGDFILEDGTVGCYPCARNAGDAE